ncbi:MAG: DUF4238 domain-containing protein [Anaerolineae bacterium]|nr:DUF4238 domain-containing protein [Anaerolineae bacterium]
MNQVTHDNHYVPKLYLKQWSDDGLHIWAYRLLVSNENVPEWYHRSLEKTAFLRDLYTEIENEEEIDEFEKWLESEFENPVQESIRKVLKDNPLSSGDWEKLASFLGAQDLRTPQSYLESTDRWKRTLPDLMEKTLNDSVRKLENKGLMKNIKNSPNDDFNFYNEVLEINVVKSSESENGQGYVKAEVTVGRKFWLQSQRFALTKTIKALKEHKWCIVHPAHGHQWFTSDNPVIKLNDYGNGTYDLKGGWGRKGGNIIMPISPRHLLFTQIGDDLPDRRTLTSDQTRHFQRIIAERAFRWLYARESLAIIPKIRSRLVDPEAYKFEEEQWRNWHKIQKQAEKSTKNPHNR